MRPLSLTLVFLLLTTTLSAEVSPMNKSDTEALSQANLHFALDLYKKLSADDQNNVAFSPFSVSTALAMTWLGARDETASEMQRTLHFESDVERTAAAFAVLLKDLDAEDKPYVLAVANRLWGQQGSGFLAPFLEASEKHFGAALEEVDFVTDPETARRIINRWVEAKTDKKIKDLLPEGSLDQDTRLVLTNAIAFKGKWKTAFDEADTRTSTFKGPTGDSEVRFMTRTADYGFAQSETAKLLEMNYDGEALSLVVVLPDAVDGLADLEKGLDVAQVDAWLAALTEQKVRVELPRFKVESTFRLEHVLGELGMKQAFGAEADFSGMNHSTDLSLSTVIHQAFVDVNEEGTEAAAATAVMMPTGGPPKATKPNVFRADHPFLFFIRHKPTNTLLFLGRVTNP